MVGVLLVGLLSITLFIGTIDEYVIAGDELISVTDNVKSYDEETQTVTITDKDNVEILDAKLLTPIYNKVGVGYQRVAEIEFLTYEDFVNFQEMMQKIELYNIKEDMKTINRTIDYKYKSIESYNVEDYKCSEQETKNGTQEVCVINGSHTEYKELWKDLDKEAFYTKGNLIIGLYTTTVQGENIEWIPTISGIKISEWAVWDADLNNGLISYLKLDESSGNALDSHNSNDATLQGTVTQGVTGKIEDAYDFDSGDYLSDTDHSIQSQSSGSMSAWVNWDSIAGGSGFIIGSGHTGGTQPYGYVGVDTGGGGNIEVGFKAAAWQMLYKTTEDTISTGTWYHIVVTSDGTNTKVYINDDLQTGGILLGSDGKWFNSLSTNTFSYGICDRSSDYGGMDGTIDEIGIWDRELTSSEVTQLYNSGSGISYTLSSCEFAGYVKDSAGNGISGANITIFNQFNVSEYYENSSTASGYWSYNISNSTNTYMVTAYYNNTLIGQLKQGVSGTC